TTAPLRQGATMSSRLNPYVSYGGDARQALDFYRDVFRDTLTLATFGESGAEGEPHADQIMHGQLETDLGFTLMAADTPPGMSHTAGNNIAISISGDDDDLRRYWE